MFEVGQCFPIFHGCAGLFSQVVHLVCGFDVVAECVLGGFTFFLNCFTILLVSCSNLCSVSSTFLMLFQAVSKCLLFEISLWFVPICFMLFF